MPQPTDRQGLIRMIGMCTYLSKFCPICPNYSSPTAPMRELLKRENEFVQGVAFDKVKKPLSCEPAPPLWCTMTSTKA
jgi:hypothetical protein